MFARGMTLSEVSEQVDTPTGTLRRWTDDLQFREIITRIRESTKEATRTIAVADKVQRIIYAQRMIEGIDAVIESRAEAGQKSTDPVPGEATGHIAVRIRTTTTGSGPNSRTVTEKEGYFDASLHNERRRWMEYVSKELGEMEVNVNHKGTIVHVQKPNYNNLSDAELENLAAMAEKLMADEGVIDASFFEIDKSVPND